MTVSYMRLWHLLLDRGITKTKLREDAGVTSNAIARMGRDEDVRVETLVKICSYLKCEITDIMEIIPDMEEDNSNGKRS